MTLGDGDRLLLDDAGSDGRPTDQSARFMELSVDLLCIVDSDGRLQRVNAAWRKILGYEPEQLLGRSFTDLIHPEDRQAARLDTQLLLGSNGATRGFETRVRAQNGRYVTLAWTATWSPEDRALYATGRDVTEVRQSEVVIEEAEERFRAAFEQAPIGMALVSIERERPGCFLRVNQSLCDTTGYPADDLIGTDFRLIAHPEDIEPDGHYVRWMLAGDISQYEVEKRLRHAKGNTLWVLASVSLVRDAQHRPLYLIAQMQNITARKEAERAARENRQRIQDIIDNTPAAIYLKDRDGRYLLVNKRFEILHDVSREEVTGKTDEELHNGETAESFRVRDLQVLASGIALEDEELIHHEGRPRTYLSTRFPLFRSADGKAPPYGVCCIATDITERKRAEEAIRSSEERFRTIINTAQEAFISIDESGTITAWNPEAEKTFGWSEAEAIGENLARTILPPGYREAHERGLERFLSTGKGEILGRRIEVEAKNRDGLEFPVELTVTPVKVDGEYAFNAFLHDISERRRGEESTRQLANVVESSGDAIFGVTPEGHIASWNPGAEQLYGYTSDEAIGRDIRDLFPPGQEQDEAEVLSRALSGQHVERYTTVRRRKDGSLVDVSLTLSPMKDAVGTIIGAASVAHDITEQKRAEEALRQAQEAFRGAFENAPIGVAFFSVEGEEAGRLLQVNRTLSEITGRTEEELLGGDLTTLTHPEDRRMEERQLGELLEGITPNYRLEKRYLRPDGEIVWTAQSVSTVHDHSGELLFGIAQVEDITARRDAQARLAHVASELEERAGELERSNSDLQEFAYVASHDLSEPLRMVSSYVTLLERRYTEKLDDDAREFIGFAVDGVTRMQALIDALLLYSRAGTSQYASEAVDCSQVVAVVLKGLERAIEDSGARVTSDQLPTVVGDPTQLGQLFQNLISNGIKFRAEKPPHVHVAVERDEDVWRFAISDNGIGIDPAHANRIFNMFQRLHGRDKYPGSGVGLAICKRIVERHGGEISVEAAPGGGSMFRFTIPADREPADE